MPTNKGDMHDCTQTKPSRMTAHMYICMKYTLKNALKVLNPNKRCHA